MLSLGGSRSSTRSRHQLHVRRLGDLGEFGGVPGPNSKYATSLGKPIIRFDTADYSPEARHAGVWRDDVVVADHESGSNRGLVALARTFRNLTVRPLPDAVPEQPPIPATYTFNVRAVIRSRRNLPPDEQAHVLDTLQQHVDDGTRPEELRRLLVEFSRRPDLTAQLEEPIHLLATRLDVAPDDLFNVSVQPNADPRQYTLSRRPAESPAGEVEIERPSSPTQEGLPQEPIDKRRGHGLPDGAAAGLPRTAGTMGPDQELGVDRRPADAPNAGATASGATSRTGLRLTVALSAVALATVAVIAVVVVLTERGRPMTPPQRRSRRCSYSRPRPLRQLAAT